MILYQDIVPEKEVYLIKILNGIDSEKRESAELEPFLNIMNE